MIDERLLAEYVYRQGDLTDRSGTVTTGGTAQTVLAVNASRKYLLVQNPSSNSGTMWVAFGQAAVQASPSIELAPGAGLVFEGGFVPTDSVSAIGPTTCMPFTIWEG